jgi:CO/xanthine dehydrogenase FAD-binding subunit
MLLPKRKEATRGTGATPSRDAGGLLPSGDEIDVLTPDTVVSVRRLGMSSIDVSDDAITVGATVTNSQLAWHPVVRDRYPVLAEAILSGATTQIRNMATVAGNILQRTRCPYFRDVHASCNRRQPGSGCDALDGFNRGHAVLGVSDQCIATHPSDMCVALAVLDAEVHTMRPKGTTRSIPFRDLHHAPGDTPQIEVALERGELITHIVIPHLPAARRSHYLKVRDRASYEFALASAAVVLDLDGDMIRAARLVGRDRDQTMARGRGRTGAYTVMTMLANDCLGMPVERVRFGLGDSAMPRAPQEGGSGLTGALGNAVHAACVSLVLAFVNRVTDEGLSPLKGCRLEGITVRDGGHSDHRRSGAL